MKIDSNETNLAKRNIETIEEIIGKNNELLIFDRGYPSIKEVITGVRIDIWTHFMRECIINYVH